MSRDTSFALDQRGAQAILQKMSSKVIKQSAEAIAARGRAMASSISSEPPTITVTTEIGTIRRGVRYIATVRAEGQDSHQNYIGHLALKKAKDAGRVK